MKTGKFLAGKFLPIVLGFTLSFCLTGCQLLILPFYVVNMTFSLFSQLLNMAIILPVRLLPIAMKYAPLALLFLEKSPTEPVYYVQWLENNAYGYRIEEFVDKNGQSILAVAAPSEALEKWVHKTGDEGMQSSSILLADNTYKNISNEELSKTWEVLKTRRGRVWLTGEAAEKFQNHRDEIYI